MSESPIAAFDVGAGLSALTAGLAQTLGGDLTIALSWPRLGSHPHVREERAGPGVIVHVGHGPAPGDGETWLWLDASLACNLVDRALGGRGQLGVATASALPSEAECGVLAYLAARSVRGLGTSWIRDVYAMRTPPPPAEVVWPLSVRWPGGSSVARVGMPSGLQLKVEVEIGWLEALSAADLAALQVGDVLISDRIVLSATTHGLSGSCNLRASDLQGSLGVILEGQQVHGRDVEPTKDRADALFIALQQQTITATELAQLTSAGCLTLQPNPEGMVHLKRGATPVGRGQLVRLSNQVGVRIQALP